MVCTMSEPESGFAPPRNHLLSQVALVGFLLILVGIIALIVKQRPLNTVPESDPLQTEEAPIAADLDSPAEVKVKQFLGLDDAILTDARFTITSNRPPPFVRIPIPKITEAQRVEAEIRWNLQKPNPSRHSFPARGETLVSIHGLLAQCTTVTGIRFAIAKGVSAGAVVLPAQSRLDGWQWSKALTDALQTREPEWYNFKDRVPRKENLTLLTRDGKTVVVIPDEMVPEFELKEYRPFVWNIPKTDPDGRASVPASRRHNEEHQPAPDQGAPR